VAPPPETFDKVASSGRWAKVVTSTIPIVLTSAAIGLVASLNRPADNVTSIAWLFGQ